MSIKNYINSKRWILPIVCIGILSFLLFGYLIPSCLDFFMIYMILLMILSSIVLSFDKIVSIWLFLSSFRFLDCNVNGFFWYHCMIFIFTWILLVRYLIDVLMKTKRVYVSIVFVSIVLILFCFINLNVNNIYRIVDPIVIIVFSYLLFVYFNEIDVSLIMWSFIFGVLVSSLIGACFIMIPHICARFSFFVYNGRFQGLTGNPNSLQCLVVVALSLLMILLKKKKINLSFCILLASIFVIIGFCTKSKAFIISLFIFFLIVDFYLIKNFKKKGIIVVLIFALFCGILTLVFKNQITALFSRFVYGSNESIIENILTGRLSIWNEHLYCWAKSIFNVLFGCGITSNRLSVGDVAHAHNMYLELLYDFGILGLWLMAYLIYLYIKQSKHINIMKQIKYNFECFIPAMMLLIMNFVECNIYSNSLVFILSIMLMFSINNFKFKRFFNKETKYDT